MGERKIIRGLDYARAIFTVLVVLAHANLIVDKQFLNGIFVQGWSGVDFFFVLSGFLFFYNYNNEDSLSRYCKKRFVRIFPVYWIYTMILLFIAYILGKIGYNLISWNDCGIKSIISSLVCIPNDNVSPIIPTAWTLPYEIFFYFIGLLLIVTKKPKQYFCFYTGWAIIIAIMMFTNYDTKCFFLSTYFLEFWFGIIVACIVRCCENLKVYRGFLYIGILLVLLSWISANMGIIGRDSRIISFGVPYAFVILGLTHKAFNEKQNKYLSFLSKASYSIYLTHYWVILIVNGAIKLVCGGVIGNNSVLLFLLSTILSIITGCIFYIIIEKPISLLIRTLLGIN